MDEMGWGFRTVPGEIPVLSFLATSSMLSETLRMFLTSLHVNINFSDSCRNIDSFLFLCSSGYVSSSSSKSICARASFFHTSGPELGPTLNS
jgi:hypothetical protein